MNNGMDKPYLRLDEWCECERSCNASSGDREKGVSVYECEKEGDSYWRGIKCAFCNNYGKMTNDPGHTDKVWYLVMGRQVGKGADDEPLLKCVHPAKILEWDSDRRLFREEEAVENFTHKNHPNYPECECDNTIEETIRTGKPPHEHSTSDCDDAIEMDSSGDYVV